MSAVIWHLIDTRSVGGAERHIANLIVTLSRQHIPAQVVLYRDYGLNPWLAQLAAEHLQVRVLGGSFGHLLHAIRSERPGLVHTHGYKAGILGRMAASLCGVPVVSTFHSGERASWPVSAYEWLDEWSAIVGERIAVSAPIRRRLPYSSTLIPSFVLTTDAPPAGPLPVRIGFVGRLNPEKGPDLFCQLAERAPGGIEWHVFGDGPLRRSLEARYRDAVSFSGVVTNLAPVWASLGLLVMPSRFEGLPLAALEALAAGVPVLASRVGALPDIVRPGATGWLFEPGDLTEALRGLACWRALDREEQSKMRRSCWQHVRENFSETAQTPKLLAVYRRAGYRAQQAPAALLASGA